MYEKKYDEIVKDYEKLQLEMEELKKTNSNITQLAMTKSNTTNNNITNIIINQYRMHQI